MKSEKCLVNWEFQELHRREQLRLAYTCPLMTLLTVVVQEKPMRTGEHKIEASNVQGLPFFADLP